MKTLLKTLTVLFLVLILTTSALAMIPWQKKTFGWENGETTKTIINGESAKLTTGYFSSTLKDEVTLGVVVKDKDGNLIGKVLEKKINVAKELGYEEVTVAPKHYQKPGKYIVWVILDDGGINPRVDFLSLEVKEKSTKFYNPEIPVNKGPVKPANTPKLDPNKPTTAPPGDLKINTKPYVFMSWSGQSITQQSKTVDLGESAKVVYVASSKEGQIALKIELLQNGQLVKKLLEKITQDSYLAQLNGSETLNLGVGKYVVRAMAMDKNGDVSTYYLNLEVKGKKTSPKPVKQSPTITLSSTNVSVDEGNTTSITVTAQDKDSKNLKLRAYFKYTLFGWTLPFEFKSLWGATFVDNGDNTGTYTFAPDYDFVIHPLTQKITDLYVAASDGDNATKDVEAKVTVTVKDINRNPYFYEFVKERTATVGKELKFQLTGKDYDKEDESSLKFASSKPKDVPDFKFTDKGKFTWTPSKAGEYSFVFQITDQMGDKSALRIVKITVKDAPVSTNHKPVLDPIGDKTVYVGGKLKFGVKATDVDNDALEINVDKLPSSGSEFTSTGGKGKSKGKFTWTPKLSEVGKYKMTFSVTDGKLTDSETITIEVKKKAVPPTPGVNTAPVLNPIGNKNVQVGKELTIKVKATDADGDELTYEVNGPTGSKFVDNKNGTGRFTWTPTKTGTASVLFGVTDNMGGEDKETIAITVTKAKTPTPINNGPGFYDVGDKTVVAGQKLQFTVKAVDLGNDKLTLSTSNLPSGASFTDNGDSTGTFTWTPTKSQVKVHKGVTFKVTDGQDKDVEIIKITVLRANSAPKIVSSPSKTASQGKQYTYTVKVFDAENDLVKYEILSSSKGMKFTNNVLSWTPTGTSKGCASIQVTEINTIQKLSDTQNFCVSVDRPVTELNFVTVNFWSEDVVAGEYLRINAGVSNGGDNELEDLRITAVIYDLGARKSTGNFDLKAGKSMQKQLVMEIPYDSQPGEYYVRVTVSNDDIAQVTHRTITVW